MNDRNADAHRDGEGTKTLSGERLIRASWWGTGVFAVAAGAAVARPGTVATFAAVVDVVLFAVGCGAFLWALVRAAGRSRDERLSVAGVWLLADSAPRGVRRALLGALGVQVVVALVSAAARPFTPLAFGILVPMYGLGLSGAWGSSLGRFPARPGPHQEA